MCELLTAKSSLSLPYRLLLRNPYQTLLLAKAASTILCSFVCTLHMGSHTRPLVHLHIPALFVPLNHLVPARITLGQSDCHKPRLSIFGPSTTVDSHSSLQLCVLPDWIRQKSLISQPQKACLLAYPCERNHSVTHFPWPPSTHSFSHSLLSSLNHLMTAGLTPPQGRSIAKPQPIRPRIGALPASAAPPASVMNGFHDGHRPRSASPSTEDNEEEQRC